MSRFLIPPKIFFLQFLPGNKNRRGKVAPEHKRLLRYPTMALKEIMELPVATVAAPCCHLYLWVPNALLPDGLKVMEALELFARFRRPQW